MRNAASDRQIKRNLKEDLGVEEPGFFGTVGFYLWLFVGFVAKSLSHTLLGDLDPFTIAKRIHR